MSATTLKGYYFPIAASRKTQDNWGINVSRMHRKLRLRTPEENDRDGAAFREAIDRTRLTMFEFRACTDDVHGRWIAEDRVSFETLPIDSISSGFEYMLEITTGHVTLGQVAAVRPDSIDQIVHGEMVTVVKGDIRTAGRFLGVWQPPLAVGGAA